MSHYRDDDVWPFRDAHEGRQKGGSEVQRLRARVAELEAALRDVAKRQREACARAAQAEATGATKCEGGPEFIAAAVLATPLVTGEVES